MRQFREPTTVTLARDNGIARIVFEGPKGIQTLSQRTRLQLRSLLEEVSNDESIRVAVFEGRGRTFIAGAEISELAELDETSAYEIAREGQSLMQLIDDLPFVTIAAINGACAGGGCELALACDLRIMDEQAVIGLPEATLGIVPGWGGTVRARHLLGEANAKWLTMTGQLLSASDALRIGLVNQVAAEGTLGEIVTTLLSQLRKPSPSSQRQLKQLFRTMSGIDAKCFEAEARTFAECFSQGQAKDGLAAFVEKRPAEWV